jgi:concanavalin A-like lectin/glucanase superfamily protein
MQRLLPLVVIGVVIAGLIAFAFSRASNSSWVAVEKQAGTSGSGADDETDMVADARQPRASKYLGKNAPGGASAGRGAEGGKAGSSDRPDRESRRSAGKGNAPLVVGHAPRAGAYLGESASGRDFGGGSGASIAGGLDAMARDPHADAGGSLAHPSHNERVEERADPNQEPPPDPDGALLSLPLSREHGTLALDSTAPMIEQDITYSDDGSGVKFGPSSVLAYPNSGNVRGDGGTISLDINPEWNGGDDGDFSLMNLRTPNDPSDLMRLYKNGRYLRFIFADDTGQERDVGVDISNWQAGQPHNVQVTWGDASNALYVDRQLAGQNTYEGTFDPRGVPMYIGSDVPQAPSTGAGGTISNVQVLGKPLTPADIASGK